MREATRSRPATGGAPVDAPAAMEVALTDADRPSVAVLPFENLSPDSSNAFFAAGLHESVLVSLSKISALDVTALRAVRRYADTDLPPDQIAGELGVSSLMSGSVQRVGDRIRLTVELFEPGGGSQLWSQSYDRDLGDVFAVQSDIARAVAGSLRTVLTPGEEDYIGRRQTEDLIALDRYMRGKAAYLGASLSDMNAALAHFQSAVEADPSFAAAWAGMADAILQRVQFFGYPLSWADSALVLAERALDLDPDLPEAHKTLGFVHSIHGRWNASAEEMDLALALRPGFSEALNNLGWGQYFLGNGSEAIHNVRRAFRLEPTSLLMRSNVGAILAAAGRHEEAATWLDGVLAEDPGVTATRTWRVFVDIDRDDLPAAVARAERYLTDEESAAPAHARLAFAALLSRDFEQAGVHGRRALEEAPGVDVFDMRRLETLVGVSLLHTGQMEEGAALLAEAEAAVEQVRADGADGWDPPWELAAVHAARGEEDAALAYLTEAVEAGLPHPSLLRLDPAFDSVRERPVFVQLLRDTEAHAERERLESLSGSG